MCGMWYVIHYCNIYHRYKQVIFYFVSRKYQYQEPTATNTYAAAPNETHMSSSHTDTHRGSSASDEDLLSHIDSSHHRCIDEDTDTVPTGILSSSLTALSRRIPLDPNPNPANNRDVEEEYQQVESNGVNISETADKLTLTTKNAVEGGRCSYYYGYKNPMIGSTLSHNNTSYDEGGSNRNGSFNGDDNNDDDVCIGRYATLALNNLDGHAHTDHDPPKRSYSYLRLRCGIRRWASALRVGRNPNSIGGNFSSSAGTGASTHNSSSSGSDVVFQPLDHAPSGEYELI
jgi:hypothetical protein